MESKEEGTGDTEEAPPAARAKSDNDGSVTATAGTEVDRAAVSWKVSVAVE